MTEANAPLPPMAPQPEPLTEAEIQALVDDRLSAERSAAAQAELARDPA
ncbi:MAG: hypothetical protein IE922_17190, partial [Sphingomonadales bacterium]|nr:hypothetical protein [Sphingomonadales bacterium]